MARSQRHQPFGAFKRGAIYQHRLTGGRRCFSSRWHWQRGTRRLLGEVAVPAGDVVGGTDAASGCLGVFGGTGAASGCLGASAGRASGRFWGGPGAGAGCASGEIFSLTFCTVACTVATSRDNCSCLLESCSTSRRITARSFTTATSCCLNSATSLACIDAAVGVCAA